MRRVHLVTTSIENKKVVLLLITHSVDSIDLVASCPTCVTRQDHLGWDGWLVYRNTCNTIAIIQINSEEKNALAKQVEAIRTNYNDRYNDICHHWGGNVLGPNSMPRIDKLEKEKSKNSTLNWVNCMLLSFLYINIT